MLEVVAWVPLVAGTAFFIAGTVGVLRFPDPLTRLHAITKADNAGLGLIILGLVLRSRSFTDAALLVLIWLLVLLASGTLSGLLAGASADTHDPSEDG